MLGLSGLSLLNRATGAAGAALGVFRAVPSLGALQPSTPALQGGRGLLWKKRSKMGPEQKRRQRQRLANVDHVIAELADSGVEFAALQRYHASFPTVDEMLPKDKYTHYTRNTRGYRKPLNHFAKWTKVDRRVNPIGF